MFQQLGLIGCGLIGGSFALALKRAGMVRRVVGYSKSPSTTERARKLGVIDVAAESALRAVAGSDIVLIAVPVAATETTFKAIRDLVEPGVLFMDVGSTKRDVVDAARRVLRERIRSFVPAHPIAGREVSGVEHADAALFSGRQVILTPLAQTAPELVQKATGREIDGGARRDRVHDVPCHRVSPLRTAGFPVSRGSEVVRKGGSFVNGRKQRRGRRTSSCAYSSSVFEDEDERRRPGPSTYIHRETCTSLVHVLRSRAPARRSRSSTSSPLSDIVHDPADPPSARSPAGPS